MCIIHSMRLPWNVVTIQKAFPTASMVSRLLQTWPKVQVMFIRVRLFPGKDIPIGSMYGIYANIWGILMVNVTIYSIHGSYGIWVLNLDSKIWTSSFEIFLESGLECQPWINGPCLILPIEIYLNFPGHQISINKYHNLWWELIYIVNHTSICFIIHNHVLQTSKTRMTKNATGSPTAATIVGAACAANTPEVNVTKADRTSMIFLGYLMVNMYILIRIFYYIYIYIS